MFLNSSCLMMCYILPSQSLELDMQIFIILLCVFGNMFYYLDIFPQILSNKFKKKHLQLNLIVYPVPAQFVVVLALVAAAFKIAPANDGCAGEPAGSTWSKFKQSFSPVGMCVHI